jgi:hypothetical protein
VSTRIRGPATRLSHAKMIRLRDCTTMIIGRIVMTEAWGPETPRSNEITLDGVFAERWAENLYHMADLRQMMLLKGITGCDSPLVEAPLKPLHALGRAAMRK